MKEKRHNKLQIEKIQFDNKKIIMNEKLIKIVEEFKVHVRDSHGIKLEDQPQVGTTVKIGDRK